MSAVSLVKVMNIPRKDLLRVSPDYISSEQIEDIYSQDKIEEQGRPFPERGEGREVIKETIRLKREAIPGTDFERIEPLKRASPKIVGSLFDRLDFLGQRIDETSKTIQTREELHKKVIEEIDLDIEEKERMESKLSDIDDKRNLKLDISILRKEKRHENIQFWRDILELRTELRDLLEKYQTESKIVDIFDDLRGKDEGDS